MNTNSTRAAILANAMLLMAACGDGGGHHDASAPPAPPAPTTTTLAASVTSLALSVTGLTEYGVAGTPSSGAVRNIVLTNTGDVTTQGLNYQTSGLPSGTNIDLSCAVLGPHQSCMIAVTPGATPLTTMAVVPTPATLEISGTNTNTLTIDISVLTYGNIYQGGYIFAFDDTTPTTGSVGGKVLAQSDQANSIIWGSDGSGGVANDAIYGIDQLSTRFTPSPAAGQVAGQAACDGALDGSCNTNNIYAYYQTAAASAPINTSSYAAGSCKVTIEGYSDWYLPAICEMGYDTANLGSTCGSATTPTLQNVQSNLVGPNELGPVPAGDYWTSTLPASNPQGGAFRQHLQGGGADLQYTNIKALQYAARCARALEH